MRNVVLRYVGILLCVPALLCALVLPKVIVTSRDSNMIIYYTQSEEIPLISLEKSDFLENLYLLTLNEKGACHWIHMPIDEWANNTTPITEHEERQFLLSLIELIQSMPVFASRGEYLPDNVEYDGFMLISKDDITLTSMFITIMLTDNYGNQIIFTCDDQRTVYSCTLNMVSNIIPLFEPKDIIDVFAQYHNIEPSSLTLLSQDEVLSEYLSPEGYELTFFGDVYTGSYDLRIKIYAVDPYYSGS